MIPGRDTMRCNAIRDGRTRSSDDRLHVNFHRFTLVDIVCNVHTRVRKGIGFAQNFKVGKTFVPRPVLGTTDLRRRIELLVLGLSLSFQTAIFCVALLGIPNTTL
jgi:hypothetical protein